MGNTLLELAGDRDSRRYNEIKKEHQFGEPKVAGLWKLALMAKFEPEELESLREELGHYERRLEKMQFIKAELQLVDERHGGKYGLDDDDKTEGRRMMDRK